MESIHRSLKPTRKSRNYDIVDGALPMLHQGMMIVGPSYNTKELDESDSSYGP